MTIDDFQAALTEMRMTIDDFRALLTVMKEEATFAVWVAEDSDTAREARVIWHAAEVALGMVWPGYLPKRAAQLDLIEHLEQWPSDPALTADWN
jgi:hypothetical protein